MGRYNARMNVRRLAWTPLTEVSPALVTVVVSSEDKRFYQHAGVDWTALGDIRVKGLYTGFFEDQSLGIDAQAFKCSTTPRE